MPTSVENPSSKEKVLANCAQFIHDICNDQFSALPYPEYSEATINALEILATPIENKNSRQERRPKLLERRNSQDNHSNISLTAFQKVINNMKAGTIPTDEVIRGLISTTGGHNLEETVENPISTTEIKGALNAKNPKWSVHIPTSDSDLDLSRLQVSNVSPRSNKFRQTALHIITSILTTGILPKEDIYRKYSTNVPRTLTELKTMELELKSQRGHELGTDLRVMRDFMRFLHSEGIDSLQNIEFLSELPFLKENTLEEILTTLLKKEAVNVTSGRYRNCLLYTSPSPRDA